MLKQISDCHSCWNRVASAFTWSKVTQQGRERETETERGGLFILGFRNEGVMKSCDHHTFRFSYWSYDSVKLGWPCVICYTDLSVPSSHVTHARWRSDRFIRIPSRLCNTSVTTSQGHTEVGSFCPPILLKTRRYRGENIVEWNGNIKRPSDCQVRSEVSSTNSETWFKSNTHYALKLFVLLVELNCNSISKQLSFIETK